MDRTSLWVAALVATALLAIACNDARAQTGDEASDPAQAIAVAETPAPGTASVESPQSGGGVVTSTPEATSTTVATQNPPPAPEAPQPSPGPPAPPPVLPTVAPEAPLGQPPTSQGGTGDPPAQRLKETPPAASEPAADEASAVAAPTSSSDASTAQAPEPGATSPVPLAPPIKPGPLGEVSRADAATQPGDSLEQLLSEVGRRLHTVQGKMDDLRHRLALGAPPPTKRLIDLRASLVRIAPMLAALEASLDAAGRLTPHLRQLLHQVSDDLRGVRATAAGLITALRHSGARGSEVRLLLQELEQFRTFDLALPSIPALGPAPTPDSAGATRGYAAVQPAPAVSPPPAPVSAPERGAAGPPTTGSRDGRGSEEPPPSPWSPDPGSATASPGGTFLFAAMASLTMLLVGLMLPALRARLDLAPGRRYNVAFLAPLERPG
jgi:hypothetical protein